MRSEAFASASRRLLEAVVALCAAAIKLAAKIDCLNILSSSSLGCSLKFVWINQAEIGPLLKPLAIPRSLLIG